MKGRKKVEMSQDFRWQDDGSHPLLLALLVYYAFCRVEELWRNQDLCLWLHIQHTTRVKKREKQDGFSVV